MKNFNEEDIDPLSLTNLILRRDYRVGGSGLGWARNWIRDERYVSPNGIMQDAAATFGKTDDIILEAKKNLQKAPVETNQINPEIFSTDPAINVCSAYINSCCRVNGRPCLFTNQDYKECGIYNIAQSTDPELFEIGPGVEQSFAYQRGQSA